MSYSTTVDWQALVFDQQWMQRLEKLSAKRFGSGGLAEEASAYVLEKLSDNEWAVFQSYKGQSKPQTYLHTLTGNFLEEFSRKRFGRPRPPEWVKREGEIWVRVWRMICLERGLHQSVIDLLSRDEARDEGFVKHIIQTLKARIPWCGESSREIATPTTDDDSATPAEEMIPEYCTPDRQIDEAHFDSVMHMLAMMFHPEVNPATVENAAGQARDMAQQPDMAKLRNLGDLLDLTDQEWVVIRMVFESGLKYREVASRLSLKAHEPGRICKRGLEKIAQAMAQLGVKKENIINLL